MKTHEIFETHKELKEVYMTSDGEPFYKECDAKSHAKTLKDKSVELVINPFLGDADEEDFDFDDDEDQDDQNADAFIEIGKTLIDILKDQPGVTDVITGDGSGNILAEGLGGEKINFPVISAEKTQELLNQGGNAINVPGETSTETVTEPADEKPVQEEPAKEEPAAEVKEAGAKKANTKKAD